MPRIDPAQLLKTLSVLLGPTGGIKSTEEVSDESISAKKASFSEPGNCQPVFSECT